MLRDLTYAARLLVKSPGFSLVTILSLALGSLPSGPNRTPC